MFKRLLLLKSIPVNTDAGLLALRLIAATSIFIKHGFEKIFSYHQVLAGIVQRQHYVMAIGPGLSLACATVADSFLTLLVVLGVATRWSAFFCLINLVVAWGIVPKMPYFGYGPMPLTGEMMIAYMAALVCLTLSGGGKYSIDTLLDKYLPTAGEGALPKLSREANV